MSAIIFARRKRRNDGTFEESVDDAVARVKKDNPGKNVQIAPDEEGDDRASENADAMGADPGPRQTIETPADPMPVVSPTHRQAMIGFSKSEMPPPLLPILQGFKGLATLKYHQTPRVGNVWWSRTSSIGRFSDVESYIKQLIVLVDSIAHAVAGLRMDPGTDQVTSSGLAIASGIEHRATKREFIGIDAYEMVVGSDALLSAKRAANAVQILRAISDGEAVAHATKKEKAVIAERAILKLVDRWIAYYEKMLVDPEDYFKYLKLYQTPNMIIRGPDMLFQSTKKFLRVFGPPSLKQRRLVSRMKADNPPFRTVFGAMARGQVESNVFVSSLADITGRSSQSDVFRTLLNVLQINTARFSEASTIPQMLSESYAAHTLRTIITVGIDPTLNTLEVPLRYGDNSSRVYIEYLLMKLFLPSGFLAPEQRMNVNNTLFSIIPDVFRVDPKWEKAVATRQNEALTHSTDLLSEMLKKGYLRESDPGAKAFLYEDPERPGSGWATTHAYGKAVRSVPDGGNKFALRDGLFFSPIASDFNELPSVSAPGGQFENFSALVTMLGQTNHRNDRARALYEALHLLMRQPKVFSDYAHYTHQVLREFGKLSFFTPQTPKEGAKIGAELLDANRILIDDHTSFFSLFLLLDHEKTRATLGDPSDLIQFSNHVFHWFSRMATTYYWVADRFRKPIWTETDRLMLLKSMMPPSPFKDKLFELTASKPAIYSWLPPPRDLIDTEWMAIYDETERFVLENSHEFGFADRFYYQGGGIQPKKGGIFERIFLIGDREADIVLSVHDLSRMTQEHTFTSFFRKVEEEGKLVEIQHPINVEMVETRGSPSDDPPVTPQLMNGLYQFGTVKVAYTLEDEHIDNTSNAQAFTRLPRWGVKRHAFVERDEGLVSDLFTRYPLLREGYTIVSGFEFVDVTRN